MLTGGQVRSLGASSAAGGAASAGASSDLPPNRLLKRSVSDCDDAGEASMLQPIANEIAATIAIRRDLPGRAAVMITGLILHATSLASSHVLTIVARPAL